MTTSSIRKNVDDGSSILSLTFIDIHVKSLVTMIDIELVWQLSSLELDRLKSESEARRQRTTKEDMWHAQCVIRLSLVPIAFHHQYFNGQTNSTSNEPDFGSIRSSTIVIEHRQTVHVYSSLNRNVTDSRIIVVDSNESCRHCGSLFSTMINKMCCAMRNWQSVVSFDDVVCRQWLTSLGIFHFDIVLFVVRVERLWSWCDRQVTDCSVLCRYEKCFDWRSRQLIDIQRHYRTRRNVGREHVK
jgi:hypothetical protein